MEITVARTLNIHFCSVCDWPIALTQRQEDKFRERGGTFYCPQQHGQGFHKTENQELKERLEAATARADSLLREKQALMATQVKERAAAKKVQAEAKKAQIRVGRGVCPCCNRTFAILTKHMATKHPEYAAA